MKKPASKIPAHNLTRESVRFLKNLRLETAIKEARAFMLLTSDPAEEFCGSRGAAIQAGI